MTLLSREGVTLAEAPESLQPARGAAVEGRSARVLPLKGLPSPPPGAGPRQLSLGLKPALQTVPPWADNPSVVLPRGLRTLTDALEPDDHHGPAGPRDHVESAIALLRAAAQAERVGARGDALLVAIEHLSRALAELFDGDVARAHLRAILGRL
ncbi:MAG: hypothetical protein JNK72_01315 [Myxococcales bacterium]|nr:hypothetical protein [Myxococcales bacterium]